VITESTVKSFNEIGLIRSDLHISALGFESRCLELLRRGVIHSKHTLFLKFRPSSRFSYAKNLQTASQVLSSTTVEFDSFTFLQELRRVIADERPKKATVDISSMNRTMISAVVSALCQLDYTVEVTFYYIPARFSEPHFDFSDLIAAGPVLPEYNAYSDESDLPACVIMGLGFEYGVGLGLINMIEPESAICMVASGHDDRYAEAVQRANFDFKFPGINASVISYDLFDPVTTYDYLSSTVRNLLPRRRISLIPMGPKLLSAIFALCATEHLGDVTLWRVVRNSLDRDAEHDDLVVSFRVDPFLFQLGGKKFPKLSEFADPVLSYD
jgi:hypothetical protein